MWSCHTIFSKDVDQRRADYEAYGGSFGLEKGPWTHGYTRRLSKVNVQLQGKANIGTDHAATVQLDQRSPCRTRARGGEKTSELKRSSANIKPTGSRSRFDLPSRTSKKSPSRHRPLPPIQILNPASDALCSQHLLMSTPCLHSHLVEHSPSTFESPNHLRELITTMRSLLRQP